MAALASFLDARHAGGRWLLRIEDLDPPRETKSAPATIIRQLHACGLAFDGDVLYQSGRLDAYAAALRQLADSGLTYPCTCSRASIPPVYTGTCRHKRFVDQRGSYAVRVRVDETVIAFSDRVVGERRFDPGQDVGDFIIKRRDQYFAYQLAVVVDDAYQAITHVIRGNDLLKSTPRQLYLARCLDYSPITYGHVPVIVDRHGQKLSKQSGAKPIDTSAPKDILRLALNALGQTTQAEAGSVDALLRRAVDAWNIDAVPRSAEIPVYRSSREGE